MQPKIRQFSTSDADIQPSRRLVSIVLPVFNEASILNEHLSVLQEYLSSHADRYRWEIVIVNDGSTDASGRLAEDYARRKSNVKVLHHSRNYGLGQAMKYGISATTGDYIVTLDIDLSYSPDHILEILEALEEDKAKLVLASPYMRGGRISNVPWLRKMLSVAANKFLFIVAHGDLSTLTCMVRGYDGPYIRSLVLRSVGMEIMPEAVYKSMIMRANISQIPAHLDWGPQMTKPARRSNIRIVRQVFSTILSGFVFRPFMFFLVPGLILLMFALWVNFWTVFHFVDALSLVPPDADTDAISWAIAAAYQAHPHTFIVGLLSLMLSVQLISLGILALQSKSYFEELFFLGASLGRKMADDKDHEHPE